MRIAFDASYSVDDAPSGIAVYSRSLLDGLPAAHPSDTFVRGYRPKQWRRRTACDHPNVSDRLLLPPVTTFQADVFHALNQRLDSRPARRVISTFHDLFVMTNEYSSPEFRVRFAKQARAAAVRSDLIIAVSRFTAFQVESLLGVPPARIRVIPHGISARPLTTLAGKRETLVLFVGAIQKRKNVGGLVEAFAAMPPEWRLVLAGSPSGYGSADILERIQNSPARSRIEVRGYISAAELATLYSRAAVFAFPSFAEGFGMPVLEAMAYGVPVLTSRSTALAEVAGNAAVLVNPANVEEIADGMRRLASDEGLRTGLIDRGRKRAEEFSWERTCQMTYCAYQEVCAR